MHLSTTTMYVYVLRPDGQGQGFQNRFQIFTRGKTGLAEKRSAEIFKSKCNFSYFKLKRSNSNKIHPNSIFFRPILTGLKSHRGPMTDIADFWPVNRTMVRGMGARWRRSWRASRTGAPTSASRAWPPQWSARSCPSTHTPHSFAAPSRRCIFSPPQSHCWRIHM